MAYFSWEKAPIICAGDIWEATKGRLHLKLRAPEAVELPPTRPGGRFTPHSRWLAEVEFPRWRNDHYHNRYKFPSDGETLLVLRAAPHVTSDANGCGAVSVLYNGQVGWIERYFFVYERSAFCKGERR